MSTPTAPNKKKSTVLETIRARIIAAERFCENTPMEPVVTVDSANVSANNPSGKMITERPIVLCAYKESDDTWHAVTVYLPRPIPAMYKSCLTRAEVIGDRDQCVLPIRVATPGYDVLRVGFGYGITRFTATVIEKATVTPGAENSSTLYGEDLVVYRTKHLWFDDDAINSRDTERILATMKPVYYTPYHPAFHKNEVVGAGADMLRAEAIAASDELRRLKVPSVAYPGNFVADVVPWKLVFSLALIEQMDDLEFKNDKKRAIEARFVEQFLNGSDTCRYCQSDKRAYGLMQFTNGGTNGTYDAVRIKYPLAQLSADFPDAVREHRNALKAAFCLVDLEVAQLPEIQAQFKRDPLLFGVYPVAAYNGGHGRAKELYQLLQRKKLSIAQLLRLEQTTTLGARKKKVLVRLNGETFGYVIKYTHVLKDHLLRMK